MTSAHQQLGTPECRGGALVRCTTCTTYCYATGLVLVLKKLAHYFSAQRSVQIYMQIYISIHYLKNTVLSISDCAVAQHCCKVDNTFLMGDAKFQTPVYPNPLIYKHQNVHV